MSAESAAVLALVAVLGLFEAQAHAQTPALRLQPGNTVIVTPKQTQTSENIAAGLLRHWLLRVAGAQDGFAVLHEGQWQNQPGRIVLAVGDTQWGKDARLANLDDDGFVIARQGEVITIAGKTPEATHYAVVRFLDRYAGVRFYMPGDLWTSAPRRDAIVVDGPDVIESPYVVSAFMSGFTMDDRDEYGWLRRQGGIRRKGGTHQHNIFEMFPPERYAQKYPEIYPIKDGQRVIPKSPRDQSWQLNFSAPYLVEVARDSISDFFQKNPTFAYVAISLNDGGRWDESPGTQAFIRDYLASHPGATEAHATSEQYWRFMAQVAQWMLEAHPGKRLVGLAYGPTRMPPSFRLPDNVTPFTNLHIGQLPTDHLVTAPAGETPMVDQWLAVAGHLGNHDWYQGSGYLLPRLYSGYWVQFLRTLQQRLPRTYQHIECYPNWGVDGPKLYILTRLLWDPQLDPQVLLRQYTDDMFGPASSAMFDYFVQLEQLWTQLNITDGPERKLGRWATQFNTSEASRAMLARCRHLLDQATAQVQSDEQRQRLALLERSFAFSHLLFQMAAAPGPDEALRDQALTLATELKDNRRAFRSPAEPLAAVKALHWEKVKNGMTPFPVPRIATPALGQPEAWTAGAPSGAFAMESGERDPQDTALMIGFDERCIYLRVECPRKDMTTLVESNNRDWRSDNVEVFFDLDRDPQKMERQLWVKTTGQVVDWTDGKVNTDAGLAGQVQKLADRYVVEIAVPFSYLNLPGPIDTKVGIRVLRNEFTPVRGRNELTYSAVWSRQLTFKKPGEP
jgi:hypothetical protein